MVEYIIIAIAVIILLIPISLILYLIITEYKPEEIEDAKIIKNNIFSKTKKTMTITTLNTGYSSLDKNQDFFVEGGKGSRCVSRSKTQSNLKNIVKILKGLDSDFYFLQEVDEPCRRSCYIDQVRYITKKCNDRNSSFAYNYKVKYVPIPFLKPMGSAISGLLSLSRYKISESKRCQLKGDEPFFKRIFFLKRCMMVNRITFKNGKELILINIHLSAYDKNGKIRKIQVDHLMAFINELTKTYKHIIIGGDWNHLLDNSMYRENMPDWVSLLPASLYKSSYKIVYDKNVNTVRSEDKPYIKGENFETIIDGFLVSPNIEVVNVYTIDHGYKYTDHNPVTLTFKMK
ncbi:MAG: endonuclease/exonuclease/phosphatase family protein [Candidatus Izimaplasma sp.]|nr:endonuclease/exonuclease/phosphatase family protein [Candidatus Izimaplasma bacterium]